MKKLIPFFLLITILSSCTSGKEAAIEIPAQESTLIQSGQVVLGGKYIGYVQGIEQTGVGPKSGGRIVSLSVQEGDRVKKWQILALVDGTESKENMQTAEAMLGATQSVYGATNSLMDSQIKLAESKVEQAQKAVEMSEEALNGNDTGLSDTKKGASQQLLVAQKQVEQAQAALDAAKSGYASTKTIIDKKEADLYANAPSAIHSVDVLASDTIAFTDTILGISEANQTKNDGFEMYLGAKNSTTKTKAETAWNEANTVYLAWKSSTSGIDNIPQNTEDGRKQIREALASTETMIEKLRTLDTALWNCLDSSISSSTFPESTIDGYKSQVSSMRSSTEQALISVNGNYVVGIKGSLQSMENVANEKNGQLDSLSKQVTLAEKALEVAKQGYGQYETVTKGEVNKISTQKNIAEKQLEIAKQQYTEALSSVESLRKQKWAQLAQISAQLEQAKGGRDMASISVSNNTAVAPFDGVVVAKIGALWQVIGGGTPIFTITKDDTVKIMTYLGESEASSIHTGDHVDIRTESGSTLSGSVFSVQPTADVATKKIPVEIHFNNTNHIFMVGSYVTVQFGWKTISGLSIPYRFVDYSNGESILNISGSGGMITKTPVRVTACSDLECIVEGNVQNGQSVLRP